MMKNDTLSGKAQSNSDERGCANGLASRRLPVPENRMDVLQRDLMQPKVHLLGCEWG